jgi:O-antigen/teichoic acid export membrane protein
MGFYANALRMLAGTLFAQSLPLLATPLLSRLYEPEAFGLQFLFMSLASALGVLATCRLELAMVMAPSEDDARSLAGMILVLTTGLCGVQLVVLSVGAEQIATFAGFAGTVAWLWLLPLFTFAFSAFHVSAAFASRRHGFGSVASAGAANQAAFVGSALLSASVWPLAQGLVVAKLLGQAVAAAALTVPMRKDWKGVSPRRALAHASELLRINRQFVVYNTPYSLSGGLLRDIPLYGLSILATAAHAGHFALARMVVMAPAALVSAGFSPVFFREAITIRGTSGLQTLTLRLLRSGGVATAPAFASIMVWGDVLFAQAFGEGWSIAGRFAMILAPAAWWAVQSSWPDRLFEVHARQGVSLVLQIFSDAVTALLFIAVLLISDDLEAALVAFTLCNLVYHHGYLAAVCSISGFGGRSVWPPVRAAWLTFAACAIPQALARGLWPDLPVIPAGATVLSLAVSVLLAYRVHITLARSAQSMD